MGVARVTAPTQVCYTKNIPRDIQFSNEQGIHECYRTRLSAPARLKNAIIIEALVKYLKAMERESLAEEARRQSEPVQGTSRTPTGSDWRTRRDGDKAQRFVICAPPGDYGKPRPAVVVQSDLFNVLTRAWSCA